MTKLFFDFDDGRSKLIDEEGFEVPDLETGRAEVLRTLGEIAKDTLPKSDLQTFTASLRDTSGAVIYRATITVSGGWRSATAS